MNRTDKTPQQLRELGRDQIQRGIVNLRKASARSSELRSMAAGTAIQWILVLYEQGPEVVEKHEAQIRKSIDTLINECRVGSKLSWS